MKTKIAILSIVASAFLMTACSDEKSDSTALIQSSMEQNQPLCFKGTKVAGVEDPSYDVMYNSHSNDFRPDIFTAAMAQFHNLMITNTINQPGRDAKTGVVYDSVLRGTFDSSEGLKAWNDQTGICLGKWKVSDVKEGSETGSPSEKYLTKTVSFSYKIDQPSSWVDAKKLEGAVKVINQNTGTNYYSLDGSSKGEALLVKRNNEKEWFVNKITFGK